MPCAGSLQKLPDGRLALRFKQVWRDGTTHVLFTPHELIEKLIPLIPRPRCHLVRYHGILGPAAKDRDKVVPTPPALPTPDAASALAAITKPEAIRKILDHLGIPSEAPHRTAARPPPQTELSGTADLADADYADPPSPEW